MEIDCSYYFLKETAIKAWQNNNQALQNKMFECVTKLYKDDWFRRVIYKGSIVGDWQLRELAENAFLLGWEKFNDAGKSGKTNIQQQQYINYYYGVFKNTFLKLLQREKKDRCAEQVFATTDSEQPKTTRYPNEQDDLLSRRQKTLQSMSPACAELMQWWYKEKLSYAEIANRKGVKPESCKQQLWRCKELFLKIFNTNKK